MTGIPSGDYRPDGAFAAPFDMPQPTASPAAHSDAFARGPAAFTNTHLPANPSTFVFPGTENVNPAEVFSAPGYNAPRITPTPLALISLLLACLFFVPLVPLVGAAVAVYTLKTSNSTYQLGRSRCISAIVLGGTFTLLQILWFSVASEVFSL